MTVILSYGGGVQSTAILALAVAGEIELDVAIFVDMGKAESPETLEYVHSYALERAYRAGIRIVCSPRQRLLEDMMESPEFIPVPFRTREGIPLKRQCTYHYKIIPFRRAVRAVAPGACWRKPVRVLLGISADEYMRMRDSDVRYIEHVYTLVERRMTRNDCVRYLVEQNWRVPPKSSCWFCPFRAVQSRIRLIDENPQLKNAAIALERRINESRLARGKDALALDLVSSERQSCMFGCEL